MLESLIGLIGNFVLPYLVLSLFAMLLTELVAAVSRLRGRTLRAFITRMLGSEEDDSIVAQLYAHPLIAALSPRLPSYIPARLFVVALADTIHKDRRDGSWTAGGNQLPASVQRAMHALQTQGPGREIDAIEGWYNDVMDAASGAYRFQTWVILGIVACAIVISVNFDAIRISNNVARRSTIEKIVEARIKEVMSRPAPTDALGSLMERPDPFGLRELAFPIGWRGDLPDTASGWGMKAVGLLTSILAIMIGAPFLFDLLNKFMVVRSTIKPWEGASTARASALSVPSEAEDHEG